MKFKSLEYGQKLENTMTSQAILDLTKDIQVYV